MNDGQAAGKPRVVTPRRQSAKVSSGARRQGAATQRVQLHLSAETVKRLGVHASLVGRNGSRIADEILLKWLARYGQGREVFPPLDLADHEDPSE